jgi:cold shock CspA family protein
VVAAVSVAAIRIADGLNRAGNDVGEHTRGVVPTTALAGKHTAGRPEQRRGTRSSGRIVTLLVGQGHGFIRLASSREVFFHRSDLHESTSFNVLTVGDRVTFELLEDTVSGPPRAATRTATAASLKSLILVPLLF